MRNPQTQTSQFPNTPASTIGPSIAPPVMAGYSGSTPYPSGFQPESQAVPISRAIHSSYMGGMVALQTHGMADEASNLL